ncbi:hypothetical protein Cst_c06170 [Thermoclostridium stercorarium subsp. stercorarium DSM 8532]|uniref:Uncharacterized protein n=3 Tax=Thermoclostridium stercorarium TaxID=1510 RepID=L7VHZ6_THES1|nr:hypothetical protein [Thermoclostridium stercorarium]AGC67635.1 hypothetical protein Cst_c06170 [Thermoclostridium stercorarium subsp. stercorarium DSM 8532]AGI38683.1 hypothetical protein Clst_0586 [Thermoclostridium stercorarium subsp. stercorarium DSM 8532]ANW98053.1 hypothetical protein CSTERTH_02840 [Thermoclostridium stercorarium subsp. thermolacticum DSM 2910]ANX00599.1 hypothetical protein CSTERLE_02820 [Thermoclostridium stercorarium subsp. leptospartum DSM 9219]UZQ86210.1 hypothet
MFIFVIIGYALLGIYEFVPLYKQKKWKEFYVNLVLTLISFIMAFLISINVKIPSPAKLIGKVITLLTGK